MTPDERKNLAEQITTNPLFIAVFDEMEQAAIERLIYETESRHEAQLRVIAIRTLRADLEQALVTPTRKGAPA